MQEVKEDLGRKDLYLFPVFSNHLRMWQSSHMNIPKGNTNSFKATELVFSELPIFSPLAKG